MPRPGQQVRWRRPEHAHALGWAHALGTGPFEVVRVVDRSEHDIPAGVILKTDLGEREINVVWLAAEGGEGRPDGGQALRPDRRRVRGAIDTAKLKAERVALLAKTLGCEAVKAGQMADKLSGLTDDAFEAHVGYLAQQLAVYRQAARRT